MMAGLFPRLVREKCHPNVPSAACAWRRNAIAKGWMHWDRAQQSWILLGDPAYTRRITESPFQPDRTEQLMKRGEKVWNAGRDTTGEAMLLEICPGCGCELPELPEPKPFTQADGE